MATRWRVGGHRLRLRDSAGAAAAAERRRSRVSPAASKAACTHSARPGPAVAGRSRHAHHRCGDHLSAAGAEPETLNLGTGGLAATAKPERIDFSFGIQAFTDTFFYANAHLRARRPQRSAASAVDRRHARRAPPTPTFCRSCSRKSINAAGLLTANANDRRHARAPEINGRIELADGEFDSYRVNLAMRELNVVADLANTACVQRHRAAPATVSCEADGQLTWRDGESTRRTAFARPEPAGGRSARVSRRRFARPALRRSMASASMSRAT